MTARQEQLKNLIKETVENIATEDVSFTNEQSKLQDDYGLDSLDRIELAIEIEKTMAIVIPDNLIENWDKKTINQVYNELKDLV